MNTNIPESHYIKEGVKNGTIFSTPVHIDYVNENNIYLGYAKIFYDTLEQSDTLLIKKIVDDTLGNITTSYAYGTWANRATLIYI